jgi:hypothetical protein
MGGVALALLAAAAKGPATCTDLARRARVGRAAARYTCSRLLASGHLRAAGEVRSECGRLATVFELPAEMEAMADTSHSMASVMHSWRA